ncbi:pentapeptide repeat-containing protein [Streptosporangium sp. NPDC048865]|uniref:pentapeptide repeat-containing protein n=1 Tax=Streptosporangium sp. NPDC048865 TaxID=3155766 RepID=UPI00341795B2
MGRQRRFRRRPRPALPTQTELDALPADRRLELIDLERQDWHRQVNTWILAAGVAATVGTLLVTGLTLRSGQDQLNIAREGQVTDRYARAVEQLGSNKREVRTAAIYALERIARDSERDRLAIRDVLAAYVREHDPDPSKVKDDKLPQEPDTDVHAALTTLARRPNEPTEAADLDLHGIRTPAMVFTVTLLKHDGILTSIEGPNLINANLTDANLTRATLTRADLRNANLTNANLTNARLINTKLGGADLTDANLAGANLASANLTIANLTNARLINAKLGGADLTDASLINADLTDANLAGANLAGADLRGVRGVSEAMARKAAKTNAETLFGPLPNP